MKGRGQGADGSAARRGTSLNRDAGNAVARCEKGQRACGVGRRLRGAGQGRRWWWWMVRACRSVGSCCGESGSECMPHGVANGVITAVSCERQLDSRKEHY